MANHPFVHIELAAPDPAKASQFYHDLCDWHIEVDPRFNYYQFMPQSGMAGAFVQPDGQMYKPGDIIPYIGTDDVDGMLKRVEELGGKILLPKTEIPGIGWFAFFADPAGNRMGLFAGNMPPG